MHLWQNWLHFSHTVLFPQQLGVAIKFLNTFADLPTAQAKVRALRQLPQGTVGKALWDFLQSHNQHLVPGYERHDLKQVLLGYTTDATEEMQMQAFMVGNKGLSLDTLVALTFVGWTPHIWASLPRHDLAGRFTQRISGLTITAVAPLPLDAVVASLNLPRAFRLLDHVLACSSIGWTLLAIAALDWR